MLRAGTSACKRYRRKNKLLNGLRLALEPLEPRTLLGAMPLISELLAINNSPSGLKDGDGQLNDWIELFNAGDEPVVLSGWKLRDGNNTWTFPQSWQISPPGNPNQYAELLRLDPGEYLVVMASGKGGDPRYVNAEGYYLDAAGFLHTNFSLKGSGEYLGLLDPSNTVVHQYNEFPGQFADISYGIAQDIQQTMFVAPGATARYFVPTAPVSNWTAVTFNDSTWHSGATGLGYVSLVPGFAVWNYKATTTVSNLDVALQVASNPSLRSATYTANPAVINYFNTGGQGRYTSNQSYFPGFTGADVDDFVLEAKAYLQIPAAGQWTFGVNSDDGFLLTITGATTVAVVSSDTPVGGNTISYFNPRGPADTLGVFNFPAAGKYEMRLVFYERGGGSGVELFAKQGYATAWDSTFYLVGESGAGRPQVWSTPIGQSGAGGILALTQTNVESRMKGINSTLLVRMPFELVDPGQYQSLTLRMKYDDGFVAYLNGYEVARRNAPGTPGQPLAWNAAATAQRPDAEVLLWETIDLTAHRDKLLPGANVLAIQALNYSANDTDFLVLPELSQIIVLGMGEHYFATPTPGAANTSEFWLHVADTKFSMDRGFYEKLPGGQSYWLQITTATPGATIRYTLDGSTPTETHGTVYTGPIPINKTTIVRAAAFKPLYEPSNVDTHTYIFLDDVLSQPALPPGFPSDWKGTAADYEMDPRIRAAVGDATLRAALLSLPTMSIVTDMAHLFDPNTGIYSNPTMEGVTWERPASIEYFDPNSSQRFQIDAGIRMYGGVGRQPQFKKHSFRLLFKQQYGSTKLRFPLFGEHAAQEFDSIILRSNFNDAWVWGGTNVQFIRDEFAARLQLAMGDPSRHGTFVHLYINGVYWGLYNPVERPDQTFSASYFGGDKDDWDGINAGAPVSGSSTAAWNALMSFPDQYNLATQENYQRLQGNNPDGTNNPNYECLLDVDNYIKYMLMNFYVGNQDWPSHNYYAGRLRGPESTGWKFYSWDAEWIVGMNSSVTNDRTGVNVGAGKVYAALRNNPEFQVRFGDIAHRYLFNDGVLTPSKTIALYQQLANQIELAVYAESARWGDVRTATPFTYENWRDQRSWILNTYLPQRTNIVIQQLRNAGLYPSVTAPTFRINGVYQHGGPIVQGASLSMTAPSGTIYYTLDGTDPRLTGGGIAPEARVYTGPIALSQPVHVKSRAYVNGQWSALNEATYYIDLSSHLRITEIMYNPAAPSPAEIAAGFTDNNDFEFIELKNISTTQTLPLEGVRFTRGIDFTFPAMSLAPGQYVVVVKNEAAFRFRYPDFTGTIAGQYDGRLDNAGERLTLEMPVGGVIHDFEYNDRWYRHTDGEGFSLTVRDPAAAKVLWNVKDGWRASEPLGGTPGTDETALGYQVVLPGTVVISEVLAHSDMPFGDAIELYNAGTTPVDVSGWFLSDTKSNLALYQIPATPPIQPGGYLVLYQSTHFGGNFALSELGEAVYLSSNAGGVPGGYRQDADFGPSPRNIPFGLHTTSTGQTDFTLLSALTLGAANAAPYLEDVIINELMYHAGPPTAAEIAAGFADAELFDFIELYNRSSTVTYDLRDFWLAAGIGFSFGWYDADANGQEQWTLQPGATATWTATLPAGQAVYEVFARWNIRDPLGTRRNLDGRARYTITHAFGSTEVIRDQGPPDSQIPGYMDPEGWVSLGTYTFSGSAQVVLTRGSDNADNWTIADKVKFVRLSDSATTVVDNPVLNSWSTSNAQPLLGPNQYAVIVRNYAAFDFRYNVAANNIPVAGTYTGSLSNAGEKVELLRRGDAEPGGYIPYYRIDHVTYSDSNPWPTEPDGGGFALVRRRIGGNVTYGNDPQSWAVSNLYGTPGAENLEIDRTPPTVPQNLSVQITLNPNVFALSWSPSQDPQSHVAYYTVFRDGEPLATTTSPSYNDTAVVPARVYRYTVAAVNRDGFSSAQSAVLEAAVPGVSSYAVPDANHIDLIFTEALNAATASVKENYTVSNRTVVSVALSQGNRKVTLTIAEPLQMGSSYLVTISGVTTLSGNQMPNPLLVNVFYEPQGSGSILREYWTGIGGSTIADLTNNPNYPNNPSGSDFPTSFEGPVDWADNYGTRFRGYVHPPVSGSYVFWISSDDNSVLYLSTDSNPANKVQIASVPGWTSSRQWDKFPEQQSAPIVLQAGQKYYIEALQKEGGGGDNIAVRWQLPGGVWENPANPNAPIPGIRLSPYVPDTVAPTVTIVPVSPNPRDIPVDSVIIVFSEQVTGFDILDVTLTRDGGPNLITQAQTLTTTNNVSFTLGNLTGITGVPGVYTLRVRSVASGITDLAGNPLAGPATTTWTVTAGVPVVQIMPVAPDPRNTAVDTITIVFSEPVTGFDLGDLHLSRDGGPNLLTPAQTLATTDNTTFTLGNLAGLTGVSGSYTLRLTAAGSGIKDLDDNPLANDAVETWTVDADSPVAQFLAIDPNPRNTLLDQITIVFSEPVTGFDIADLRLTRDGGANLLTGAETLATNDNITWVLSGLAKHTATGGGASSFVAFNDHVAGPATHPNATTYAANGTAAGVLKDIRTGDETGVTLTISQSGVVFQSGVGLPSPGTDAYRIFNGFVDFSSGAGASIELDGNDFYLHQFSGLDTTGTVTYNVHATSIRGNSAYTRRWTKVTLVGAASATPDHSVGNGIVVLSDTEVALWSGANSGATQGFVVGWTNIDPGPDGIFALRSEQYVGAIPVSVDPSGVANDSKGYALTAVRLEAISRSQPVHGDYLLVLRADGSGIRDAVGNWLAGDVSIGFIIDTQPPTVAIEPVTPSPRLTPVEQVQIVFNEPVTGLDLADLRLTRDGGANLLTAAQTLTTADNIHWTLGNLGSLTAAPGNYTLTLTAVGSGIVDRLGYALEDGAETSWTKLPAAVVVGEYLFYNNSAFDGRNPAADAADDQAIAPDKFALRPGDPQATFANYTSYSRGINGLMIDIQGLLGTPTLSTLHEFFQFRVGNTSDTSTWIAAPAPSAVAVRQAPGQPGVTRVSIVWPDAAIANQWLEVTVPANLNTGLVEADRFYFGNLVGETGAAPMPAMVTAADEDAAWGADSGFRSVAITNPYDFNRDRRVSLADVLIARQNDGAWLVLLELPPPGQGIVAMAVDTSAAPTADDDAMVDKTAREDANPLAAATALQTSVAMLPDGDAAVVPEATLLPATVLFSEAEVALYMTAGSPSVAEGPIRQPAEPLAAVAEQVAEDIAGGQQGRLEGDLLVGQFVTAMLADASPPVLQHGDPGALLPGSKTGKLSAAAASIALPQPAAGGVAARWPSRWQADWSASQPVHQPSKLQVALDAAFAQSANGNDVRREDLWSLAALWDWLEPLARHLGGKRQSSPALGNNKAAAVDAVLAAEAW